MPIYEYQCSDCGHAFDELQKMDADPLVECPKCAQPSLVKLVSAPSFRLKGSGWYETDFKKDKRRNLADDGSQASSSKGKSDTDSSGGSSKSESKKSSADSASKEKSTVKASGKSAE